MGSAKSQQAVPEPRDHDRIKKLDFEKLDLRQELGRGRFGMVNFGSSTEISENQSVDVAVKKLGENPGIDIQRLEQELQTQAFPAHVNLVKIYGWCKTEKEDISESSDNEVGQFADPFPYYIHIVMEYMQDGSLLEYLEQNDSVSGVDLLNFAHQICCGMQHLAKYQIVHRNLATKNIMVITDKKICKISDFELAVRLGGEEAYIEKEKVRLEVRWMAPECLAQGRFSIKSDVWAFGVVMWELFSEKSTPYPMITSTHEVARDVQRGRLQLDCPKDCPQIVYDRIMKPCWSKDPSKRPDFNRLKALLNDQR